MKMTLFLYTGQAPRSNRVVASAICYGPHADCRPASVVHTCSQPQILGQDSLEKSFDTVLSRTVSNGCHSGLYRDIITGPDELVRHSSRTKNPIAGGDDPFFPGRSTAMTVRADRARRATRARLARKLRPANDVRNEKHSRISGLRDRQALVTCSPQNPWANTPGRDLHPLEL
jgi:hypothetical protein